MMGAARMEFVRRVSAEHRGAVIALGVALALNLVAYAAFVFPLARSVGRITERTQAAETELKLARSEHARATATLTGKSRAAKELETFYTQVLPSNQTRARDFTFQRLAQRARESNLHDVNTRAGTEGGTRGLALTRFQLSAKLSGSYVDIRRFIDELERIPEFVVIDRVRLSEAGYQEGELNVDLELSTYYREGSE